MKKNLHMFLAALTATLILASCATNRLPTENLKSGTQSLKEDQTTSTFVQLNDGTIKHYQTLELVTGVFKTPHLLADGKIKIDPKEIIAYQNNEHYAVSQKTFASGRRSFVAVETLPGFAVRIAKGKLNVYCKKFYNGRAAVDELYVQSGEDGQITVFNPENFKSIIKDNQEAFSFFIKQKDKDLAKNLQATADLYNNTMLMSKMD